MFTKALLNHRYEVIRSLGAGGMGETYLAIDTSNGQSQCVVKQLKPASQEPSFLNAARRLFQQEVAMLQKLGTHDRIPSLLDYFEQENEFYLVQEFIDGQPLSAELLPGRRWTEAEVITLLNELLSILTVVHQQNVIHRDIKPDNIIRRASDNALVLIDFGAVKEVRIAPAKAGQLSLTVAIGTPGYMPMEQSGGKPRCSSDLYAVGILAIQALTGLLPTQFREDEDGEFLWHDYGL